MIRGRKYLSLVAVFRKSAPFAPCHRQTSSTYTRYAVVGLPSAGRKIHRFADGVGSAGNKTGNRRFIPWHRKNEIIMRSSASARAHRRTRIIYAKALLVDDTIPITEIAMRSGFNSIATFNRLFKAQIGYTPTEYRQMASHG